MDRQAVHRAMMDPATYPGESGPIQFAETHVSCLYFTSRHAYKIKKPVDFGFLNFTTLDRRRFYCEEEVRLNRRFAPGTYLGVVEIRRAGDRVILGSDGDLLEYAVWMNRLPAERMLDRLIAAGDPGLPAAMEKLGERLAKLHREAPAVRGEGGQANAEVVQLNWRENFSQIAPFAGRTVSARALGLLAAWVNRHLEEEHRLLQAREAAGFVRDGHGDLHAEHVCLTDPIQIYDCIEFNRRFRIGDVAADIAFLLMDLEFRGRRDLADRLLSAWRRDRTDAGDLAVLLPFYKVYRAFVRGKVESFLAGEETADAGTRRRAAERAAAYFHLALGYLCPPALVLISGLMGTGKTTLGAPLARSLGATLLRSDVLRKELAGARAPDGRSASFAAGIYAPDFTRVTYDRLLETTRGALAAGGSVVVDASFSRREERERFRQAAAEAGVPCFTLIAECPRETALERLDRRQAAGKDVSDGRRDLYDRQAAGFEPLSPGEEPIRVDTSRDLDYNVDALLCEIINRSGMRP